MSEKKFLQAETEEKKILAEGNLVFKVKCQGIIIKIPLIVMTVNFLQNALKQRFWGSENLYFPGGARSRSPNFV